MVPNVAKEAIKGKVWAENLQQHLLHVKYVLHNHQNTSDYSAISEALHFKE